MACTLMLKDILAERLSAARTRVKQNKLRQVHYLSMEFLLGRSLANNARNLGVYDALGEVLDGEGIRLADICEIEPDPGTGNGGLGRLAACFMDSMATLGIPSSGYTIRYQHGIFKQRIVDGQQVELPDSWLGLGESLLIPRFHRSQEVRFGGEVTEKWENGRLRVVHLNYTSVLAVPYDFPVSGYATESTSVIKMWDAQAPAGFDLSLFSRGEYLKAVEQDATARLISMVLYPEDNHIEGKSLRLKQQYFFVSATIQYIVKKHKELFGTLSNFSQMHAIHINDTHPALAIPELMRILLDEEGMDWDQAFQITANTVSYTNHTILTEALERWPENLMRTLLPRIMTIVDELNERHCRSLWSYFPGDFRRISDMALKADGEVRMANLAVAAGRFVNGVSALHSEILKTRVFNSFYLISPDKFRNVTNGIDHRRWLCGANPELSALIESLIGSGFKMRPHELSRLAPCASDSRVLSELEAIKRRNKVRLSDYIAKTGGPAVDPDSIFDIHAKRLHEYKRQLMNVLHILSLYLDIKDDPNSASVKRTFFFAAKASPGYHMAKQIIRLINSAAKRINGDPAVSDLLKVVFVEDYKVSLAELMIPAAELSEQISTAGKEASGTGNMKFMLNGALTIGTMDGATVEMSEAAGRENMFIFGLSSQEAAGLLSSGSYNPARIYSQNPKLRRVLDFIGTDLSDDSGYGDILSSLLVDHGGTPDPYLVLADFDDYANAHAAAGGLYANRSEWNRRSLINIAASGSFSSDVSIRNYAKEIWRVAAD